MLYIASLAGESQSKTESSTSANVSWGAVKNSSCNFRFTSLISFNQLATDIWKLNVCVHYFLSCNYPLPEHVYCLTTAFVYKQAKIRCPTSFLGSNPLARSQHIVIFQLTKWAYKNTLARRRNIHVISLGNYHMKIDWQSEKVSGVL